MRKVSIAGLAAFCLWSLTATAVAAYEADSSKGRQPKRPPPRSTTEKIMDVPGRIIVLPFTLARGVTKFVVVDVVLSTRVSNFIASLSRVDRVWGKYPALGYSSTDGWQGQTCLALIQSLASDRMWGYYATMALCESGVTRLTGQPA